MLHTRESNILDSLYVISPKKEHLLYVALFSSTSHLGETESFFYVTYKILSTLCLIFEMEKNTVISLGLPLKAENCVYIFRRETW